MGPERVSSDCSDSSLSYLGSTSSSSSSGRNYLDPWDAENAMYVRGKRISFASDPGTFSSATAAVESEPAAPLLQAAMPQNHGPECGCEQLYNAPASHHIPQNFASQSYLSSFCTLCDADKRAVNNSKQAAKTSPPASVIYKVPSAASKYPLIFRFHSGFLI